MSKKILISTLLGASLSFATWGYFPLKESDSGLEVKGGYAFTSGDVDADNLLFKARLVIGGKLEISVQDFGYQFGDNSGLTNMVVGGRFQLSEKTSVFLDYALPMGSLDFAPSFFHAGLQHALVLQPHVAWGTEIGYTNYFETSVDDEDIDIDEASVINLTTEIDLNSTSKLIWFIGGNLNLKVSESEYTYTRYDWYYGDETYTDGLDDAFDIGFFLFGGVSLKISKNTAIEEEFTVNLFGSGSYDFSFFALKTSLKHSF